MLANVSKDLLRQKEQVNPKTYISSMYLLYKQLCVLLFIFHIFFQFILSLKYSAKCPTTKDPLMPLPCMNMKPSILPTKILLLVFPLPLPENLLQDPPPRYSPNGLPTPSGTPGSSSGNCWNAAWSSALSCRTMPALRLSLFSSFS